MRYQDKALEVVSEVLKEDCKVSAEEYDVDTLRLVWFSKTLQHYKALVFATKSGKYVEVTYNGDTGSFYVDVYVKEMNVECWGNDTNTYETTSMDDTHEVPVYVSTHKVDTISINESSISVKEVDASLVTEPVKSVN